MYFSGLKKFHWGKLQWCLLSFNSHNLMYQPPTRGLEQHVLMHPHNTCAHTYTHVLQGCYCVGGPCNLYFKMYSSWTIKMSAPCSKIFRIISIALVTVPSKRKGWGNCIGWQCINAESIAWLYMSVTSRYMCAARLPTQTKQALFLLW